MHPDDFPRKYRIIPLQAKRFAYATLKNAAYSLEQSSDNGDAWQMLMYLAWLVAHGKEEMETFNWEEK